MVEVLYFLGAWLHGGLCAWVYFHLKIKKLESQKKKYEAGLSAAVSTINDNYQEIAGLIRKNEELGGVSFLN